MSGEDEIICNGSVIKLPSLVVVKPEPKMPSDANIDWLLHVFFARRDFQRCCRLIERELHRHLNPEYLYFVKGLIDRAEGNNIDALRNLQKALELNSNNIENHKEIGKTLYAMGRFHQALGVFQDAEKLSPREDHEIYHFIGELLHRSAAGQTQVEISQREQAEAKAYFEKAVQCGKKLESFVRLASIYRKEKEYLKAIEVLENCLQLSPENDEVLTEISVLYLKVNDTQKAYDRLLEVVNINERCSKGLLAFGAILQSRNDIDGALNKYSEIAGSQPEIAELWNNIGLCFFKKQKFIVAVSSLRKAIWLSPLNYNALYNLSLILIASQQYASAFHTLAAAINLRGQAECYMLLGLCLRKLGDNANAYVALERGSQIAKNSNVVVGASRNPLVHLNFSLFCYEIGRYAQAAEQYVFFTSSSQDLLLPTEYKFQGTKLKSLLKISTSNLLLHHENPMAMPNENESIVSSMTKEENASTETAITSTSTSATNQPDKQSSSTSTDMALLTQTEMPFDIHAVVNVNVNVNVN